VCRRIVRMRVFLQLRGVDYGESRDGLSPEKQGESPLFVC